MSKVQTEVSSTLFWHPFQGSVDKEPLFVQYQRYQAQSASSSDVSFYIESPANGVLLDNEVWLVWTLRITDDVKLDAEFPAAEMTGQLRAGFSSANDDRLDVKGWAADQNYLTALRCGLPMQRATQNVALDINGTVMTYELAKYHDVFNRLYISQQEAPTVFSTSCGGGFDDGNHSGMYYYYAPNVDVGTVPPGIDLGLRDIDSTGEGNPLGAIAERYLLLSNKSFSGGINAKPYLVSPFVPDNNETFNKGFKQRADYLEMSFRKVNNVAQDPTNTSASVNRYGTNNYCDLIIYEKLCFSPFHFYDNRDIKMSIPNIRTLQLTFQISSKYSELMFRSAANVPNFSLDWYQAVAKPYLYMRWFTPPPGYAIPKQITIPISKIWSYTNSTLTGEPVTDNDARDRSTTVVFKNGFSISNISLPAIPDLFILYFKRRLSEYSSLFPDDYLLSIKRIQIDMEGNSGKLNNADKIHLWNMYRRHLRLYPIGRDTFENWYRYHCIVPFTASDLGVIKGAGYDNPIQISLSNIDLEWCHSIPSIGYYTNVDNGGYSCPSFNPEAANGDAYVPSFDMHLICVYDKYALTLTSDGSSELQLLRVNSGGATSTAPPMAGPAALADISI